MRSFFVRKIVVPISTLLLQGIGAHKLSFALSAGLAIGVFPIFGVTTIFCLVIAFIFRLNIAAIQLSNYLIYPLQFILFIPFIRLGEWLFNIYPMQISMNEIFELFKTDTIEALKFLGMTILRAVVAWAVITIPLAGAFYFILKKAIEKWLKRRKVSTKN